MDVLCTDKTGTLTQDKISLIKYLDVHGENSDKVYQIGLYNSYFQSGLKNPLDEAILNYKIKEIESFNKLDEVPYDFNRKRLSVILKDKEKNIKMYTKGQPEEIFKICKSYEDARG
jgi:P-type Mg2+ transporter